MRFAVVVTGLGGWFGWLAWRRYTMAYLPDHEVFDENGHLLYTPGGNSWFDPETGRRIVLEEPSVLVVPGFPLVALVCAARVLAAAAGHRSDVRVGWQALRERPLGLGIGTALFA